MSVAPTRPAPARRANRKPLSSRIPAFRRNLWLFLFACLLAFIGIGVQGVILNLYFLSLGYHEDFLGFFSLANTAGIGGAALLAGRLSNRFGPRRTLIGAIAIFGLSSAAMLASPDQTFLYVLGLVNGVSLAHMFVPTATFVMDNADPSDRSTAYAAFFAAQAGAMMIGSYLGGAVPAMFGTGSLDLRQSYLWTLLIGAALAFLGAIPLFFANDSKAGGSQATRIEVGSATQQRRQMFRDVRWMLGSNFLIAISMGVSIPFLNVFFSLQLGAPTEQIGAIFALGSGAMVVASLIGPVLARRFGIVPTVVAGRLLTGPVFLALAFSMSIPVGATFYVLRTLFTNVTWPVDNAFTMELVRPDFRSTLAGLRSASWNLAWAVASGLGGLMIVQYGFLSIFAAAAAFGAAGSIVYFCAFRHRIQRSAPEPQLAAAAADA
jgi:predicted MFS family arabinose efflux permease